MYTFELHAIWSAPPPPIYMTLLHLWIVSYTRFCSVWSLTGFIQYVGSSTSLIVKRLHCWFYHNKCIYTYRLSPPLGCISLTKFFMHPSIQIVQWVTKTCMSYCNVWVKVVFNGFLDVYIRIQYTYSPHDTNYISTGVLWLVRFIHRVRGRRRKFNLTSLPWAYLTQLSIWWYSHNDVNRSLIESEKIMYMLNAGHHCLSCSYMPSTTALGDMK